MQLEEVLEKTTGAKTRLEGEVRRLQDTLGALGHGDTEYEDRTSKEVKDLREQLDQRRVLTEQLRKDVVKKLKTIADLE